MKPIDPLVLAVSGLDAPQIKAVANGMAHLTQLLDNDDAIEEAGRVIGALRSLAEGVDGEPRSDP